MHLEPVEIQHVKLRRSLFGYERVSVDQLLENVTASYENVWFERGKLEAELASLRNRLDGQAQAKEALEGTVKVAQSTADEVLAEARSKADAVVDEAHERSLATVHEARLEHQRLRVEIKKTRGRRDRDHASTTRSAHRRARTPRRTREHSGAGLATGYGFAARDRGRATGRSVGVGRGLRFRRTSKASTLTLRQTPSRSRFRPARAPERPTRAHPRARRLPSRSLTRHRFPSARKRHPRTLHPNRGRRGLTTSPRPTRAAIW